MEEMILDRPRKGTEYLTCLRDTEADIYEHESSCEREKHAVRLPVVCGQLFLPFQPRHWPKEAALLELHLRGSELCCR